MKIILSQDVKKVGKKGEIKEVPDGYGRNFLIARGFGKEATAGNVAKQKEYFKHRKSEIDREVMNFSLLLKNLSENPLSLKAKTNEKGHLFKAIRAEDIHKLIEARIGIEIKNSSILIQEPIKEIGEHKIGLQEGDKRGEFILSIEKE